MGHISPFEPKGAGSHGCQVDQYCPACICEGATWRPTQEAGLLPTPARVSHRRVDGTAERLRGPALPGVCPVFPMPPLPREPVLGSEDSSQAPRRRCWGSGKTTNLCPPGSQLLTRSRAISRFLVSPTSPGHQDLNISTDSEPRASLEVARGQGPCQRGPSTPFCGPRAEGGSLCPHPLGQECL